MEKKIFIASTEQRSGKSLVTIGLISALQGIVPNVGYMKPIGQRFMNESNIDEDAVIVKKIFKLKDELNDLNPGTMDNAQNDRDLLFEKIFDSYERIAPGRDVIVIEGTDYTSTISALEFDINAELAKNLGAPVLLVAKGSGKTINEIVQTIGECTESFREMGCNFLGVVINRFESRAYDKDTDKLKKMLERKKIPFFGVLRSDPLLSGPRLSQIADRLDTKVVYKGDDLSKIVTDAKVLAMAPENALEHIKDKDGYLLITPGDRVDLIFTALIAQKSICYPNFSGIILTGDLVPGENVKTLMSGLADAGLTMLSVQRDTYNTALEVNKIKGEITADDTEKIDFVNQLVENYVDVSSIYTQLGYIVTNSTTPRMFQYRILEMAKVEKKHVVLPEGNEGRIIRAAAEILYRGICDITLLGGKEHIIDLSKKIGANLDKANIVDPSQANSDLVEEYTETYYQLRKHKGVTKEMARDMMLDPTAFGVMMVHKGHADGFVSGAVHSTADTLRPVLRLIRTRSDVSLASSIFFMCMPDEVLVYGDCALVEDPDAEQLADIAITSAETARSFGIEPFVAMLSYSTGESGKGKDVDKVRKATSIAKTKRPDIPIEGPIQYDAAISEEVAKVKLQGSEVAGKATVYIFPDLNAGNTAYKAVQRTAQVPAIGPVVQGLNKPANDLSRGAQVKDIVYTIAITSIQAQQN
jgi:phosphate acetyltransferase